jgi:mono/diheme cytochrome c family protein
MANFRWNFAAGALLLVLQFASLDAQSVVTPKSTSVDRAAQSAIASKALLDLQFMYEGRGMVAPPNLPPYRLDTAFGRATVRLLRPILEDQFGLIVENDAVVGYHDEEYKDHHVGVVGCAVCHAGRAAGVFIPGLGNKTIDIFKLAQAAINSNPATIYWPDAVNRELHENAMHFMGEIGNPLLASKTRGLIPIALIRKWFFDTAGEKMDSTVTGSVKIPSLWSYGEKRKVGSFSDGFGRGVLPGWAVAVELVGGQKASAVHTYLPKIKAAEDALAALLPPPYPFALDAARAARGAATFVRTCAGCHGTYERDGDGYPVYKSPLFISLSLVGTDSARVDGVTPRFRELVAASPLNDIIQATDLGRGYLAQRLNGIWARFPYLHNGSVPSLYALLNPLARPAIFSLRHAGELDRYSPMLGGLADDPSYPTAVALSQAASNGDRSVYDTSLFEHSNVGHDFASLRAMSDVDRYDLIEYLKTL